MTKLTAAEKVDYSLSILTSGNQVPRSWEELRAKCEEEEMDFQDFLEILTSAQQVAYKAAYPNEAN